MSTSNIVYDTLDGNPTQTIEISNTSTLEYPMADILSTMGPVYLPRIYGKDLTALEIGSSGKVAVTLSDTHAFDLTYNPTTTVSTLSTVGPKTLHLATGDGLQSMNLNVDTKNMELTTPSNIVLNAANVLFNAAGAAAALTGSDYTVQVAGKTFLQSTCNIELTSSQGSAVLSSANSNVYVLLNHNTCNLDTFALNNAQFTAANELLASAATNAYLTAQTGQVVVSGHNSNAQVILSATGAQVASASNVTLSSTSGAVHLASNKETSVTSASNILLSSTGGASFVSMGATSLTGWSSNYSFNITDPTSAYTVKINSAEKLKVTDDKVIMNTDVDIYGVINSISVQNTELHVADKTIELAYPPSGSPPLNDGSDTNSKSGIVVNGLPASASNLDPTFAETKYEKSFKWAYGSAGMDAMLTNSGINTESYWELKGGRFQMSAVKNNGKNISFAWRINEHDELEMVKYWDDANGMPQIRRIAKFGRSIL